MSKKLITLVLENYRISCMAVEGRKKDKQPTGPKPIVDAFADFTSSLIGFSQGTELCMFRNILMDAELAPSEVAEVELVLKQVEAEFTDGLILESVRTIRTKLQQRQHPKPVEVVVEDGFFGGEAYAREDILESL